VTTFLPRSVPAVLRVDAFLKQQHEERSGIDPNSDEGWSIRIRQEQETEDFMRFLESELDRVSKDLAICLIALKGPA
jgi:hypothetical protein